MKIKLYKYDELGDYAKDRAFYEHRSFLISNPSEYEDENGNIKYFDELYYNKEVVEESIRINEYLFFYNGDMANITQFTGKNKKIYR